MNILFAIIIIIAIIMIAIIVTAVILEATAGWLVNYLEHRKIIFLGDKMSSTYNKLSDVLIGQSEIKEMTEEQKVIAHAFNSMVRMSQELSRALDKSIRKSWEADALSRALEADAPDLPAPSMSQPRIGRGRADSAVIVPKHSLGENIYEAVSDILDDPRELGSPKIYRELEQAIIEIMRSNDWIPKSDAHDYCNSNQ